MAFYYVKNTGTAGATDAGRFATRQTGAFTNATSYTDLTAVLGGNGAMTDVAAGDTICVSDLHVHTQSLNIEIPIAANDLPTIIESVDDTARETLKQAAAAQETTTGGSADVYINFGSVPSNVFLYGLWFKSNDNIIMNGINATVLARNCIFEVTGSSDISVLSVADGNHTRLENCELKLGSTASNAFQIANGGVLEVVGGLTSGAAFTDLIAPSGNNGGLQLYATGFDMSSGASTANIGSNIGETANTDDNLIVRMHNCTVPTSAVLVEETSSVNGSMHLFEFSGVDVTDAYRYHYADNLGTVISDTSIYVTGDVDLEGSGGYSYKIVTVSGCSKVKPFRWKLPVGYEDLSVASTDTIRIRLTSATTLTQEDVAVFVGTSDTTTNTDMNLLSSIETKADSSTWIPDHTVTSGTELANDNSQWTGALTNEYAITVTPTSVDASSPLAPVVWIEVYTDVTLYVSSELVFEA